MSTTVPCTNPAHGVTNHVAGSAAAMECQRSTVNGAGLSRLPGGGVPTPAIPVTPEEPSIPRVLIELEDISDEMCQNFSYPTTAVGELSGRIGEAYRGINPP